MKCWPCKNSISFSEHKIYNLNICATCYTQFSINKKTFDLLCNYRSSTFKEAQKDSGILAKEFEEELPKMLEKGFQTHMNE